VSKDKKVDKTVKSIRYPKEASSKWNRTRKLSIHKMVNWASLITITILKKMSSLSIIVKVLRGEGRHLSV